MIELRGVRKQYETVTAVDALSLRVEKGDIFGILGPNGAGKSTTIRMILGILKPDRGEILLDGVASPGGVNEGIGYLPEERGLYKKSTVKDYLLFMGELKGRDRKFLSRGMDLWLERFGLSAWKDRKTEELSKGMSQKVGFITAVLHDPEILILDEPFSGLDPVSSDQLRGAILELSSRGKTILFSTHIMEQAEKLCRKILLIDEGRALVEGNLEDIKAAHGHNSLVMEFDGDGAFLKELPQVVRVSAFPRYVEVELTEEPGAAREVLRRAADRLNITKFEVQTPSLHKIFVDLVGGKR